MNVLLIDLDTVNPIKIIAEWTAIPGFKSQDWIIIGFSDKVIKTMRKKIRQFLDYREMLSQEPKLDYILSCSDEEGLFLTIVRRDSQQLVSPSKCPSFRRPNNGIFEYVKSIHVAQKITYISKIESEGVKVNVFEF